MVVRPDGSEAGAGRGGRAGPCRAAGRAGLLARRGAHRRALQAGAGRLALWRHGGLVGRPRCGATPTGLLYFVGREDAMIKTAATASARTRSRKRRSPPAWSPRRWRSACPTTRLGQAIALVAGPGERRRGARCAPGSSASCPISCSPAPIVWRDDCRSAPTASSTATRCRRSCGGRMKAAGADPARLRGRCRRRAADRRAACRRAGRRGRRHAAVRLST